MGKKTILPRKRLSKEETIFWTRAQAIQENENKLKKFEDCSSEEEHKVDALASGADEGRDKLRKAAGSSKYTEIRRYPNWGTTRMKNPGFLTESIG